MIREKEHEVFERQDKEFIKLVDSMECADARTIAELMFEHFDYDYREKWIKKAKELSKVI